MRRSLGDTLRMSTVNGNATSVASLIFRVNLKPWRSSKDSTHINMKQILGIVALGAISATTFAAEQGKLGYQDTPMIPGTKWHVHDGERPQPQIGRAHV